MKEEWEYKTLGECGTFTRGGNFLKSDFIDDGVPCVHYGQIHTKFGIAIDKHLTSIPAEKAKKMASKGDLLIAITSEDVEGSCKCTAWLGDYDVAMGGHSAIYKHTFDPKYISYYFRSYAFYREKEKYTHGFKVVEIKPSDIAKIPVPVPSIEEQQRIVTYLDTEFAKIDALKAKAEQSLKNAKDLFQAALKEMLEPKEGWEERQFGEMVKTNVVGLTRGKVDQGYDKKFPYFKMNNISHDNALCWDDLICVDANEEEIAKYSLMNGDFLFNTRNSKEWVGKSTVYRNTDVPVMLYNNNIMRIRFVDIIDSVFVAYSFMSDFTKVQIEKIKSGTTNVWAIYYRDLSKITLTFPSIEEQHSIVNNLDSLQSKVSLLQSNFDKITQECDALKQALLKQVFE